MNEAIHKETAVDSIIHIDDDDDDDDDEEVVDIAESIREAQNFNASRIEDSYQEAQYFDASSMAPLTPTSLVSIFLRLKNVQF
jgi:hypothetical protein